MNDWPEISEVVDPLKESPYPEIKALENRVAEIEETLKGISHMLKVILEEKNKKEPPCRK